MNLVPGVRLGPYTIEAPLGAGGMGEVYRARDSRLERAVALKLLPAAVSSDPDRLARFEREAKLLAALNHPHIAQVYGFEQAALPSGETAHVLALFPPFLAMLIGLGTPPLLAVYSLACIVNLTAGLTHYGTTTAPIVFAERYVTMGEWWRVGLLVSFVNIAIWLTIGFAWWRFLGFW